MIYSYITLFILALVAIIIIARSIRVVPQQTAYVVERLGRYQDTLSAGIHVITPFIDRIAYKHTLKEQVIEIPEQVCITKDNVQVGIDGIVYLQVVDAKQASYGIANYFIG